MPPSPEGYISITEHLLALRTADQRFNDERDRRYAEVNIEREKALKIKEEADKVALDLARDIQVYKDEKANELRSQITSERGQYVTQREFRPVADVVTATTGKSAGIKDYFGYIVGAVAVLAYVVSHFHV